MKQRIITGFFIVLVTVLAVIAKLLPYHIGDYIFDIFLLFIVFVASYEIANLLEKQNKKVDKLMITIYCVFNYCITLFTVSNLDFAMMLTMQLVFLLVYLFVVVIVESIKNKNYNMVDNKNIALNTILACVYPAFMLMLLVGINHIDDYVGIKNFSLMFIVLVFAITMLTDTMAYFVGVTFKGPKLAPKISPKKTISGAIGGLLGGVLGAMLVYLIILKVGDLSQILSMYNLAWWHFLIIGLLGSVIGQCGDLFESKIKRSANIKDSGDIFPGHGGMLDRVDAMTFVSVFIFLTLLIIVL